MRKTLAAVVVLQLALSGLPFSEIKAASKSVSPSANAGKRGEYEAATGNPKYRYLVYVPPAYCDTNPAGIHLFFHHKNKQNEVKKMSDLWAKHFSDPHNLIGIGMIYEDGDTTNDVQGKADAAYEALAQIIADYKIVIGRGAISSGGWIYENMAIRSAKKRGPDWPFNHVGLHGNNLLKSGYPTDPELSWFMTVDPKFYTSGTPSLGASIGKRYADIMTQATKKGSPDAQFIVETCTDFEQHMSLSAGGFARSDLAFNQFLLSENWNEREFKPIVKKANSLALGTAHNDACKLLERPDLDENVRSKALLLKDRIEQRIRGVSGMARRLPATDPVLSEFYTKIYLKQLKGWSGIGELEDYLKSQQKTDQYKSALAAYQLYMKNFPTFLDKNGKLDQAKKAIAEEIKKNMPAGSNVYVTVSGMLNQE